LSTDAAARRSTVTVPFSDFADTLPDTVNTAPRSSSGTTTGRADFVVGTLDNNETTQMRAQIDQIS
jgi:hypothetical protein